MVETKVILLIGRTGRGKSALANVVTNTNNFKENERSISETKEIQTEKFKDNDDLNYLIIDTPGIGDTKLPTEKILDIIAEAVYLVKDGVSQVFFVTNGRFEQYEMATYNLLRTVIFDQDITKHTAVVRTRFKDFKNSKKCENDIASMIERGGELAEIIKSCQGRVLHVDNPPISIVSADNESEKERENREKKLALHKKSRDKSKEKIIDHLKRVSPEPYHPPKLQELSAEIVNYMESKKSLEKELKEKFQKKRFRRLRVKIITNFRESGESNILAKDKDINKKTESVSGREKEFAISNQIDNNQDFGNARDIEKEIKELEKEKKRLKEEIQIKEDIIRQKVFQHIFNNYDEIVNIPGGDIFISSIKDDDWGEKSEELIKHNRLVSQWLSQYPDHQLTQSWINNLKSYCGSGGYLSFCVWLIESKKMTIKEALKNKESIGQLVNEYLQKSKEDRVELKTKLDLKSRQNWQLLNIVEHLQEEFENWTSGDPEIDKFIQKHQSQATHWGQLLEWIFYGHFTDVEYLAEGGFGKVYKAVWKEGPIKSWDEKNNKWERSGQRKVVLKSLDNSRTNTEFLQEINCHKLFANDSNIINCYGISQDPQTKNYLMVMDYLKDGNLRQYLLNHYQELDFEDKLYQLYTIALGLNSIHEKVLVHRDFHSGNILVDEIECYIIDLGLSRPANSLEEGEKKIYGVLPYVAPEVLQEKGYTQAADIYSSGIVAYEILTGLPPYYDQKNGIYLAWKVCQGTRPQFLIKIPKSLENLINRCWDTNPSSRPTASELYTTLLKWYNEISGEENTEFAQQVKNAEEFNKTLPEKIRYPHYLLKEEAVIHSELLSNITQELFTMNLSATEEDEWIAQQEIPYNQPDKG